HTLHKDRKTELKLDDHLTVGNEQHIRIGSNRLVEAGQEIHTTGWKAASTANSSASSTTPCTRTARRN
ncbi:hypothetical protein ACWKWZ_28080, partial [Metapseudomonas otitidis]